MEILFLLFFVSWNYPPGTVGQCSSSSITDYVGGGIGEESTITTFFAKDCLPTGSEDKFIYQKHISDRWEDLFECRADYPEGFALDRGDVYDIHDRASGRLTQLETGHVLTIQNSVACESGQWRFVIIKSGNTLNSNTAVFDIDDIPQQKDIAVETPAENTLLANRSLPFSCTIDKARPQPKIIWSFNGDIETGSKDDTPIECGGGVWSIYNVVNKKFDTLGNVDVKCILEETGIESKVKSVNISAPPAFAEEIYVIPKQPAANEAFTINCTASGTNVGISWTLNEDALDMLYFEEPVITQVEYQGLDYGQVKATVITLKSKQIDSPTPETIRKQSGKFRCFATVLSETVSKDKILFLGSGPIEDVDHESHRKLKKGQATLECNVTAYPEPVFKWHKYDELLPDTTWNLDIVVTEDCNYTCTATNDLGNTKLYFIVSVETSDGLTAGIIASIVIAVIVCIAAVVGILGFLYKKKLKKDEEVVAYAESGNVGAKGPNATNGLNAASKETATPAVYAEVNKDKNKNSPTNITTSPVYSEVNKDYKKKRNKREATEPVSSVVNTSGHRPLPRLTKKPGSINTGPVYSEVNKPKHGWLTPIENQHYDNSGQRNDHGGLHYADVDFLRQGNGSKQSHDTKNLAYEPTEYAQIDHRKSAGHLV